jgi:hypothetical protein
MLFATLDLVIRGRDVSLAHQIQTSSWNHLTFCPLVARGYFNGDKAAGT